MHAVRESGTFCGPLQVATRRTRTAGKVEIPNVDDHVSKLEHMGKETVKKLQDIKGSAVQSGIDINVPDNRIDKGEQSTVLPADLPLTNLDSQAFLSHLLLNAECQ